MKGRVTLRTIKPGDSQHLSELNSKFEKVVEESRNAWEEIDLKSSALHKLLLDLGQRISIIEERLNEPVLTRLWREFKERVKRCLQFTSMSAGVEEATKDTEK